MKPDHVLPLNVLIHVCSSELDKKEHVPCWIEFKRFPKYTLKHENRYCTKMEAIFQKV
jgi:hypothetical protein